MEKKYDIEAVKEPLDWAQKTLDNKKYPSGRFEINTSATIIDCGVFLKSMMSVIFRNRENPTFYPTIDQLCTFIISYLCILLNFCKEVGPFIINFCSKFLIVHESNVE